MKRLQAVKLTHLPTNLQVLVHGYYSEFELTKRAKQILAAKLYDRELTDVPVSNHSLPLSGIIRSYNLFEDTVKDARIERPIKGFQKVHASNLDVVIEMLIQQDEAQKRAAEP